MPDIRVRPRVEFLYTPGQAITLAPKTGFAGCYFFRHETVDVEGEPPDSYTQMLYVDTSAGSITCTIGDDGFGLAVDVPECSSFEDVRLAILRFLRPEPNPGGPDGPPGSVTGRP